MAEFYQLTLLALDATIRVAVPLILAALAGLYSERSGIVDIGLEGKMLGAACAAGIVAALTTSAWAGLAAAIVVSTMLALLHGFACITHRGNQVVSGVAINIIASGLTTTVAIAIFAQGGQTPSLPDQARFMPINLPGAQLLGGIPILGPIYEELLSGHNLLVYISFLIVPLTWWVIYRTRFGLRLRAVGENPAACDTAGISVAKLRYLALICCGILCGIAGAYLAIGQGAAFGRDMTAGRGFIALAALIFGKWKPVPTMLACLLFGLLDAIAARIQGALIPGTSREIPVQLIEALPYILTVVLLAGFIGKSIAPKASGIPYSKERT